MNSALNMDMNSNDAFSLIDIFAKMGISEIDILGGEPMLVPWMIDFVKHAASSGISLNISTNGSLPNVGFSIQGFSETHNTLTMSNNFSRAITGLKRTIAAGKNPIVKSTLMQTNINEIYDLVSYLAGLGIKRYYLLYEDIIGRQKPLTCFSFSEFWKFYSKIKVDMARVLDINFVAASGFYTHEPQSHERCDAGIKKIAVLPDGSAFPCNLFAGFKEFLLGNIFEDGMGKILRNPILESFRKYDGNNRCIRNNCDYYLTCRGGCPAHSYYFYGTFDIADPRCAINPKSAIHSF